MILDTWRLLPLTAIPILLLAAGCSDRNPADLEMARARIDPLVFDDDFGDDVYFQAFFQTHLTAVELDSVFAYGGYAPDGARSLKVNVAPQGSALGLYTGGVLTSAAARDLADFNALTFYARSSSPVILDVVGFGNDNTGTSRYEAGRLDIDPLHPGISLTRDWTFFVVPIPAPSRLISERGMFTFAEGVDPRYPDGYDIWFDEIRYAHLDNVAVSSSFFPDVARQYFVGSMVTLQGATTTFDVDGADVDVTHSANYLDFVSSDPSVAAVTRRGIEVVGVGDAVLTATVQGVDVDGVVAVSAYRPPAVPAASPSVPRDRVISLFSDVYDDVPVDTWRADWGGVTTQVEDYVVAGDNTKMYYALNWVGIDFRNAMVDATDMTHFHLDVYAPAGTDFKVKLVSFPPALGGRHVETLEHVLRADSTPPFEVGSWSPLEIPLTDFVFPESFDWGHIGQLVLASTEIVPPGPTTRLVLVDNIYWHK